LKLGIQPVAQCGVYLQLLAQIPTNQSTQGSRRAKQKGLFITGRRKENRLDFWAG